MYYPIRTIAVGVGELDAPDPSLAAALALAQRTGASVHAVHAYDIPPLVWGAYLEFSAETVGLDEALAEANAEALMLQARTIAPDQPVHCIAKRGTPDRVLLEVAEEVRADLVVIGATHRRGLTRQILGTTAQRVLRHASVPVLVIHGELPAVLRRVLVTTDLSPMSATVHEVGLDLLEGLSPSGTPEVVSLLTVDTPIGLPSPLPREALERFATRELREFLDARRQRELTVEPRVRYGPPAPEILQEAESWPADLVILGTHSRSRSDRFWLGSVAERTIRDLRCGALVVPAAAAEQLHLPAKAETVSLAEAAR